MQELIDAINTLDNDEDVRDVNQPKKVYMTDYDVYDKLGLFLQGRVDKLVELCEQYLTSNGRINTNAWNEIRKLGFRVEHGGEDLAVLKTSITMIAFDCY